MKDCARLPHASADNGNSQCFFRNQEHSWEIPLWHWLYVEQSTTKAWESSLTEVSEKVVSRCDRCAKIDPAVTFTWDKGAITCSSGTWKKLAVDITHCVHYIWPLYWPNVPLCNLAAVRNESASEVSLHLSQFIAEFASPPQFDLSDNGTVLRRREILQLLNNWEVKQVLACAYCP